MEIGRWQLIEQVYNSVLDADPERRSAILDEACAGDPDLRREVESLLSASDAAHSFLSNQELKGHIGQLASKPAVPVVGTTVGRYHVLSLLGAGAMGEVYLARDSSLDRQVALKLLPHRFTQDPERVTRFVREAKAASSLSHPNIITIHEIGQTGDTWFLTAEYIPGGTLRERLASGMLPRAEAIAIVLQCAGALAAAHHAGVVHRDVKPENIMVRPDGVAKVVDFGLARMLESHAEGNPNATQAGAVMGTPRYMSPEQARGQRPDARSDVFSLGAVLYELIAGRPAFPGATPPEVFAALFGSEPDLVDIGSLGGVIAKALAKDAAARYQSMEAFADDLRNVDIAAAPATARLSERRWYGMRARHAAIAASVLGIAAVAGYAAFAGYDSISRAVVPDTDISLKVVPLATFAGTKGYVALSPDGGHIAFSWRAPGSRVLQIYRKPVGEGEPVQLTFSTYDDVAPAWSPDGQQIAFNRQPHGDALDRPQEIYLVPAAGGGERKIAEGWRGVSWSPDGKTLALTRVPSHATAPGRQSGGVSLLSIDSGQSRELTVSQGDSFPIFSPDGRWVAFKRLLSGRPAQFFVIPAEGGTAKQLTFEPLQPIRAATWTADSREIVFASLRSGADGSLWRVPITGNAPQPLSAILRDASDPSISPQGRLAYREEWIDNNLYLFTARDVSGTAPAGFGEPAAIVNSSREDHSTAISPDGERIAFVSERSGTLEIWVAQRDGSQARPLTSLRAQNTGTPRWSPDGRRIAFDSWASGASAIYVVDAAGGVPRALTTGSLGNWMPSWSPDGAWIYFSRGGASPSNVWKMPATGGDAIQLTHGGAFESHPSPDGTLIYFSKASSGNDRSIWSVPAGGGVERPVPELSDFRRIGRTWGVIDQGIFFVSWEDAPQQTVRFLSFQTRQVTTLFRLQKQTPWGISSLALSRDGQYGVATELDHSVNDLMMIENFR